MVLTVCLSLYALGQTSTKNDKQQDKGKGESGGSTQNFVEWDTSSCTSQLRPSVPHGFPREVSFKFDLKEAPQTARTVQPYVLVPESEYGNPTILYAGQVLVVRVRVPEIIHAQKITDVIPLVSVGIATTQVAPLNPAPLRQSITPVTKVVSPQYLYACAEAQLVGDTVPTVTVSILTSVDSHLQPLQLMEAALPQVHVLSFFNLSTGIIASSIKDKNVFRVIKTPSAPASGSIPAVAATYQTASESAGPRVAPALFFTAYLIKAIDAEVPFQKSDMIPEPSVGFSLTNPSGDFFIGASSEFFVRNVQLVYGLHYGQVTALAPNQVDDPSSSTPQATEKVFKTGAFVGLTFNIDFIKGLFSGK